MQKLDILNNKDKKAIIAKLEKQYGFSGSLDYVFMRNNKNRLFIINKDLGSIDTEKLRIDSLGLYFGEDNQGIRLSIEGSQIVGADCSKNVLELDEEQVRQWMAGEDFKIDNLKDGFYIIRHGEDYMGCCKIVNGKLYNYVPKERRV